MAGVLIFDNRTRFTNPDGTLTPTALFRLQSVVSGLVSGTTTLPATAITVSPTGGISSTNAQAAFAELDAEKATTASLTAGLATKQDADATLTALASVVTASDILIYATGVNTFATTGISAYGRNLIDDPDAATARTTLGLGTVATATLDIDGTLFANSDARVASQKAVKTYADQLLAAQDAMVFKGVVDCSTNPNYPAADRGHTYRVSVAGKIGGAAGVNVESGDILLCTVDGTPSGNQATVGANWVVVQANLDGAVIGPASAVDSHVAFFDGVTGKLLKDSGLTLSGTNTGDQFTATTASRLIGRGSAAGAGAAQEIALGFGLTMTGTTLSVSGSPDQSYSPGSVTVATETGRIHPRRLKLTGAERLTVQGTGSFIIKG